MACEEKSKVPENPKKTSPEDTQQVVSKEPQQTPSEPSQETPFKESEETPAEEEGCKIKKTILTLLLCAFVFLTGCATITMGKYQNILVTSEPPGVKVRSCTGVSLTTPGSFELARNHNHTLVADLYDKHLESWDQKIKHRSGFTLTRARPPSHRQSYGYFCRYSGISLYIRLKGEFIQESKILSNKRFHDFDIEAIENRSSCKGNTSPKADFP